MENNQNNQVPQMIVPTASSTKKYVDIPQGQHPAILFQIVDLGTQKQHNPTYTPKREIKFCFELPFQRHVFSEPKEGEEAELKPKILFTWSYNYIITDGSNLKKFVDDVIGRKLAAHEYVKGWNIAQLLHKEVLLGTVKSENKKNPTEPYDNIGSIVALTDFTKGQMNYDWTQLKLTSDPLIFSIDPLYNCFKQPVWGELWDGYKNIIMKSEEFIAFKANGGIEYVKPESANGPQQGLPLQDNPPKEEVAKNMEDPTNFM